MIPSDSVLKQSESSEKTANKVAKLQRTLAGTKAVFRVKHCRKTFKGGIYLFVVRSRIDGARKYFEARRQADAYAELKNIEVRNQGAEMAIFPTWLRVMAERCQRRLAPHGKTLSDATDHFVGFLESSERSCTTAALLTEILAAKRADGASDRYLTDLKHRLKRFAADFSERTLATITAPEIDDWLRSALVDMSPVTRNNFRRVLIVAFNYAKGRGYCLTNPAVTTAKAKQVDAEVQILSLEETRCLLEAATLETLPYFALGCFAGLRPAELERLEWSDIDFEAGLIEVSARKSKTATRRFVRIRSNLAEWLVPFRFARGAIMPGENARKKIEAVRAAAGFEIWKANALRHSFASYHLARFNDAAGLALEMGHTSATMIFEHYRQLVRPIDAEHFWNIAPTRDGEKILAFV